MVGRLLTFWEGNFSGAMLNFGEGKSDFYNRRYPLFFRNPRNPNRGKFQKWTNCFQDKVPIWPLRKFKRQLRVYSQKFQSFTFEYQGFTGAIADSCSELFPNWCGDLGGGFKYFLCSPLPGGMIQFDEHIFQVGWNHQPGNVLPLQTCPNSYHENSPRCPSVLIHFLGLRIVFGRIGRV